MKKNFIYLSISILISSWIMSCSSDTPKSTDQLFSEHFEVTEVANIYNSRAMIEGSSSDNVAKNKILVSNSARGVDAYNKHHYSEAIQYFSAYVDAFGKKNTEIGLYLSISYLADNQLQKAKEGFLHLLKKGNKSIKKDAEWYLVLTLIKSNKVIDAQTYLDKIIAKKVHRYRPKALQLKKQLEVYLQQK